MTVIHFPYPEAKICVFQANFTKSALEVADLQGFEHLGVLNVLRHGCMKQISVRQTLP